MSQDDNSPASWSEDALVESSPNFQHVPRISATRPIQTIIATILEHEESGIPLIVEDWDKRSDWDTRSFSIQGFLEDSQQQISVRNVESSKDIQMPLEELINHYQTILKENRLQENTLYGKDLPCPKSWEKWIGDVLPEQCHLLGPNDMFSHLSANERAESLMCYIGIGETFTPAHKDPCGSFGHNIMCFTSENGSAFWFMSDTGELEEDKPSKYFREKLYTDLDLESHKLTVQQLREAPFTVYCAEQRLGDLVLVPPRSCHQVVNAGGITIKMSWSRMGLKSLEYSLRSELPLYHRICRPETYRVKLIVFRVLQAYTYQLQESSLVQNLPSTTLKILDLFDAILVEEWSPDYRSLPIMENEDPDTSFISSCDFCGADIFQSFFACTQCSNSDGATMYTCCPSCFVEGRTCRCGAEHMKPYQAVSFSSLTEARDRAAAALKQHSLEPAFDWTPTIKGSSHIPIFKAACFYHKKVLEWYKHIERGGRDRFQCSRTGHPGHSCHRYFIFTCSPCHRALCFLHNLQIRGIHSVEVLLAYELGETEWHRRHKFKPKNQANTPPKAVELYYGEHSKRLADLALVSRQCRPIDSVRSQSGFYDVYVLRPVTNDLPTDPNSHQLCDSFSDGYSSAGSLSSPLPSHQSFGTFGTKITTIGNFGFDEVRLTPLSDLEDDLPLRPPSRTHAARLSHSGLLPSSPVFPPSPESSSPGCYETTSSAGPSNSLKLLPNPSKQPYVELTPLSALLKKHAYALLKRPRSSASSSTDVDVFRTKTVVPIASRSSSAIPSTRVSGASSAKASRAEESSIEHTRRQPFQRYSKRRTLNTAHLPPGITHQVGVPNKAKRLKTAVATPYQTSSPSLPKMNIKFNKNVSLVAPAPVTLIPSTTPSVPKPIADVIISELNHTLNILHPGDTLNHHKTIEAYKTASVPELFLSRLLKEYAENIRRIQTQLSQVRAEQAAARVQQSFAKDVFSVNERKALQDECEYWKESFQAQTKKTQDLQDRLDDYYKNHNTQIQNRSEAPNIPVDERTQALHDESGLWKESIEARPKKHDLQYANYQNNNMQVQNQSEPPNIPPTEEMSSNGWQDGWRPREPPHPRHVDVQESFGDSYAHGNQQELPNQLAESSSGHWADHSFIPDHNSCTWEEQDRNWEDGWQWQNPVATSLQSRPWHDLGPARPEQMLFNKPRGTTDDTGMVGPSHRGNPGYRNNHSRFAGRNTQDTYPTPYSNRHSDNYNQRYPRKYINKPYRGNSRGARNRGGGPPFPRHFDNPRSRHRSYPHNPSNFEYTYQ